MATYRVGNLPLAGGTSADERARMLTPDRRTVA
jgi:hypothetical protein